MTSLQFYRHPDYDSNMLEDWGTGRQKGEERVEPVIAPNWHTRGEPLVQPYALTKLKLSDNRSNDQLLPKPQESVMGNILINKPFPAEHPFSSHIPRLAVIPKFDSPEDPTRGVTARNERPINAEMPAMPHDVILVNKTKGFGIRHEIHKLPRNSEKEALFWHGDNGFDQLVKAHGGSQPFYPHAPQTAVPNLQTRPVEMRLSERTANSLRNVERNQWETSYGLNHAGLGPVNTLDLDNLDDKKAKWEAFRLQDDNLYQRFISTFDPARPVEGRTARQITGRERGNEEAELSQEPSYTRMMVPSEIEEDRLLHGKRHANLPDDNDDEPDDDDLKMWKTMNAHTHPAYNLSAVSVAQAKSSPSAIPCPPAEAPTSEESYLNTMKAIRYNDIQEIEAKNRWRTLEAQTPAHNINLLQIKYDHVDTEQKPRTFYNHENKYNEERAGMYQTSYSPHSLTGSMSEPLRIYPDSLLTRSHSSLDELRLAAENQSGTQSYSNTYLRKQAEEEEVFEAYIKTRRAQRASLQLQPSSAEVASQVQDGGRVCRDSLYGEDYNVKNFLQENQVPARARRDPRAVMSLENQRLENVRMVAALPKRNKKTVTFADGFSSDTFHAQSMTKLDLFQDALAKNRSEITDKENKIIYKPYISMHPLPKISDSTPSYSNHCDHQSAADPSYTAPSKRPMTSDGTTSRNQFQSLSSNFGPKDLRHSSNFDSAYQSQFAFYDIRYREDDPRFSWLPGFGSPRPQTTLLELQNAFRKSDVQKTFHERFPETNPDLREHIVMGRKHSFWGMNAQVIRG